MKLEARPEHFARPERSPPLSVPLLLLAAIGAASVSACGGVSDGAVQLVPPPPVQPAASPSPDASSGGTTVDGGAAVDGGGGGGITCTAVDGGTAVDAGGGGGITCTEPGTAVTGPPIVPGTLNHITLSGYAIDEACAPVPNATIRLEILPSTEPVQFPLPYVDAVTDATGAYTVEFDAVPDVEVRLVSLTSFSSTYESDFRYINVATQQATYNFHFRHREIVTIGATTAVKLSSADPICHNNVQDMYPWYPEWTCHTLRLQAPSTGTLTVQMDETDAPSSSTQLLVEAPDAVSAFSKTASLPVSAGQWVVINPELIRGGPAQWVNITTALCGVSP
jgi:hypothetical protein